MGCRAPSRHSSIHSIVLCLFSPFSQTNEHSICVGPFIHHQNNPLHRTGGKCLLSHSKPPRWFGVEVENTLSTQTWISDRERQGAGIAPGETWAGSKQASTQLQASAEVRLEQRQQPSRAQQQIWVPRALCCSPSADPLLYPRIAAEPQVTRAGGQGLDAGVREARDAAGILSVRVSVPRAARSRLPAPHPGSRPCASLCFKPWSTC